MVTLPDFTYLPKLSTKATLSASPSNAIPISAFCFFTSFIKSLIFSSFGSDGLNGKEPSGFPFITITLWPIFLNIFQLFYKQYHFQDLIQF